jgi:hypothetical protein
MDCLNDVAKAEFQCHDTSDCSLWGYWSGIGGRFFVKTQWLALFGVGGVSWCKKLALNDAERRESINRCLIFLFV